MSLAEKPEKGKNDRLEKKPGTKRVKIMIRREGGLN